MMLKSADARVNGAAIEAQLRKELGATQPIPFHVFEKPLEAGTENPLIHMLTWASRGQAPFIHAVVLELQYPGPWAVTVHCVKTSQMYVVGARLAFAATLRGTVTAPIHRIDNRFGGNDALSAGLNNDGMLQQMIQHQLRPKIQVGGKGVGGFWISMPTFCSILPGKNGTVTFALGTMPEVSWTGMGASFHAPEFMQIAGRVQQHLDAAPR
jgi:hypothetical protein